MTRSLFLPTVLGICAWVFSACSSGNDGNDPVPPPVSDPVVKLTQGETTVTSVSFVVEPGHAESCAWMLLAADQNIPSAADILSGGESVSASDSTPVTVGNLEPKTDYVAVAAVSGNGTMVASEPLRLTTSEKPIVDDAVRLDRVVLATYYDEHYNFGEGTDYYVLLTDTNCFKDEYGYFQPSGEGSLLRLDFYGEPSPEGEIALPEGTYTLDANHGSLSLNPYATGLTRSVGNELVNNTFDSGVAVVETVGDTYTITVSLTDTEQVNHKFQYAGSLSFTEYTPPTYDPIVSDVKTTFTGADGLYYGDRDKNGLGYFEIFVYDVPMKDGFLSRAGNLLSLNVYAPLIEQDGELYIPDGVYTIKGSADRANTIIPGYVPEGEFYPHGSYCEQDDKEGSPYYALINGGTMEVRRSGTTYTATFSFTTADRISVSGTYSGEIRVEDRIGWREGGGGWSTLHRDVTPDLSGITKGKLVYMGDYARVDCASYMMDISAEGWPEAMQIEVLCEPENTTDIALGHYTVMPGRIFDNYVPGMVVPGYMTNSFTSATWYLSMDATGKVNNGAPVWAGTLDVSKTGDKYTVTFDFEDDCTEPFRIKGSWTGEFEFVSNPF